MKRKMISYLLNACHLLGVSVIYFVWFMNLLFTLDRYCKACEIINYKLLHIYANFGTFIKQRNIYVKFHYLILRLSSCSEMNQVFFTPDNG